MIRILKYRAANLKCHLEYISKWNSVNYQCEKIVLEFEIERDFVLERQRILKSILYVSGKRDFLFPLFIGSRGKRKELSVAAKIKKGKRTTMADEALWHSESALVR